MRLRAFKYASPFLVYTGSLLAFFSTGIAVWLPLIYAFAIIPLLELFLKPNTQNLSAAEEEMVRKDRIYDVLLWLVVPFQYTALICFLYVVSHQSHNTIDLVGKTAVMGLLCGTFGINVGHELGHRVNAFEQRLAQALLLTSLYTHFFIEHNKGHHKHVATPQDPSSARLGEPLYLFWLRTVSGTYGSAWRIANEEARKKGHAAFSLHNEMLQLQLVQLLFVLVIYFVFGGFATILFIAAAVMGFLLLETVNYIEHYGLQRKQVAEGKYERALPGHSWNSNHVIGRVMLFELSRHSDHHYLTSRKYQILRHHDDSPQMPTGYPGMMLMALVPPVWFWVMNRRIRKLTEPKLSDTVFA
jgi:alkane 1-monooxygenase